MIENDLLPTSEVVFYELIAFKNSNHGGHQVYYFLFIRKILLKPKFFFIDNRKYSPDTTVYEEFRCKSL